MAEPTVARAATTLIAHWRPHRPAMSIPWRRRRATRRQAATAAHQWRPQCWATESFTLRRVPLRWRTVLWSQAAAVGPPLAIIIRMPPSAAVVSPACIASQRHQRGLVSDSSLHADGSGASSSFGWRCLRCSGRCRRLPPRHCPRVSRVPGSRLCSDDHHPHGVASRALSSCRRPAR